ncbi:MAG: transglycosylase SLT domain-containing protein [Pyrinomonadaceae bacterium]|nr:transglycosylase SLT domain-containing protein [Pyrinomonadaceae bacterium]
MLEVFLTYSTSEGSREIAIEKDRTTFGRGDADCRIDDEGLSRVHSTVHRDGGNIWIIDENSTNGSFVNGEQVRGSGTILKNGDVIKIGNHTKMTVHIGDGKSAQPTATVQNQPLQTKAVSVSSNQTHSSMMIPILLTMFALFVIGVSALFVGVKVLGGDSEIVYKPIKDGGFEERENISDDEEKENKPEKTPKSEKTPAGNSSANSTTVTNKPETLNSGTTVVLPTGKKYQAMAEDEKNRYIAVKSEKIARIIGNQKSEPIPPEAVAEIKRFLNGYVGRLGKARTDNCTQGGWLKSDFLTVLDRATKNSPFINRAFNTEGVEPQIGIYIAMIESEHCPCLESPTHAKGMFQFLASSAPDYGLSADQRCEPEPAAKAAAKYIKSLMGRFGTASDSVPLSIASYNSGQGNLSKNMDKVFAAVANQDRNFWTLAANQNKMEGGAAKQFIGENSKYVPKFFATAIIGENPQDFGVNLQPLSTYTK